MTDKRRVVLAAGFGKSPVWFLDLDSGKASPAADAQRLPGAFDWGQGRQNWTAVQIEDAVGILTNGSETVAILPQRAWQIFAAADASEILIRIRSRKSDESGLHIVAVGSDGSTRRAVELPLDENAKVFGEVASGIVTNRGIVNWKGQVLPYNDGIASDELPDSRPFGVLAGQFIVFEGSDHVEIVDTVSGRRSVIELPPFQRDGPFHDRFTAVWYNSSATWLVASNNIGSVVVGATGVARWLPGVGRFPGQGWRLWCGEKLLLLDDPTRGTVYYHPTLDMWEQTRTAPIDWWNGPVPRVFLDSDSDTTDM